MNENFLKSPKLYLYNIFRNLLTLISPTLNTKFNYYKMKGKSINLKNPKEIEEKLSWLKLYNYADNELVIKCADKLRVRDYVTENGHGDLLNDLYYVFENVEEIEPDKLPNQFALKWTTGAGGNFICSNKKTTDVHMELKKLDNWIQKWKKNKPYLSDSEMHYQHIEPKLICEKYLARDEEELPVDYKIYCFNGVPKTILVMEDREKETKGVFMTPEWDFISYISKYQKPKTIPKKPKSLETMLEAASNLSKPFPFVRVDFFEYEKQAIFGELTFTPAGSVSLATTKIDGVPMGELLDITDEMENFSS